MSKGFKIHQTPSSGTHSRRQPVFFPRQQKCTPSSLAEVGWEPCSYKGTLKRLQKVIKSSMPAPSLGAAHTLQLRLMLGTASTLPET